MNTEAPTQQRRCAYCGRPSIEAQCDDCRYDDELPPCIGEGYRDRLNAQFDAVFGPGRD